MTSYRVLVVDDSAFMRKIFSDLIASDPQFEIAATAADGQEAVAAAAESLPDLIVLDLEMPKMNGLEALERIMKQRPTPIIMMSGTTDDGTRETIKALHCGAFDFIRKPSGAHSPDIHQVKEILLEKMHAAAAASKPKTRRKQTDERMQALERASESRTFPKPRAMPPSLARMSPPQAAAVPARKMTETAIHEQKRQSTPAAKPALRRDFRHLVLIGTSTGGPRALHEVITALPEDFAAPVLVVQHMPPKFTHSLAVRLNTFSKLHVAEAVDGEQILAGKVYIAPGGWHMAAVKKGAGYFIALSQQAPRNGHRPSVDVLFESCAPHTELERHAVLMTGMGSDGALGMKALRESGARSAIAEAEQTCIVYGMPRAAIESQAATAVLPLGEISAALARAVRS